MTDQVLTDITVNGIPVLRAVAWDWAAQDVSPELVPKEAWGPGPWAEEPDKLLWVDHATGLGCAIVREPYAGHLCGYVRLRPGHLAHGMDLDDPFLAEIDVHGGVTYSRASQRNPDRQLVEDQAVAWAPSDDDDWFVGFDCSHARDRRPATDALFRLLGIRPHVLPFDDVRLTYETYRDVGYVMGQCAHLAHQLDWGVV